MRRKKSCPGQKGLGAPFLSLLKYSSFPRGKTADRQRAGVLRRKRRRGSGGVGVSDWEMLRAYKRRRLAPSKTVDGRTEKNGRLCGVMPWRAVKSSLQGWSKLSSSANPSVPVLSSPAIHPFTHLYLCLSDEDKGKHSLTHLLAFWLHGAPSPSPSLLPSLPPLFFSRSLQARLAGLISNCDLTTWWKDWHAQTSAHGARHTDARVDASAHM